MAVTIMEEIIIKQEIEELVREEELLTNSGSSEEKFLVVQFPDENSLSIVPSSWVDGNWCFWPPIRNYKKIMELVKNMQSPELSWSRIKVLVMKSADSYEEAAKLEEQATHTSDLDIYDTAVRTEVRRRKKRSVCVCLEGLTDDESNPLPPMKKTFQGNSSINSFLSNPQCSSTPSQNSKDERFKRKVLNMLEDIQHDIRQIRSEMRTISTTRVPSLPTLPSSCPDLPCERPEDLKRLESLLEDETIFQKTCDFLSSIGGSSVRDCTKRILSRLMSNGLALNYNWKGTRGIKLAFSSFLLVNKLIFGAVRNTCNFAAATEVEVQDTTKKWLMHSRDRDGAKSTRPLLQ